MTYTLLSDPDTTTTLLYEGPEGSPNGTLEAVVGAIVLADDGGVYLKTVGSDERGWTQIR